MIRRNQDIGAFEGVAGRAFIGSISFETLITGFTVVSLMKAGEYALARSERAEYAPFIAFIAIAFLLARIGSNAASGESRGMLFSTDGGDWGHVFRLGMRFLFLSALWIVPLELLGWTPDKATQTVTMLAMGQGAGASLGLTFLVAGLMVVSPPILLIVALGSPTFLHILAPTQWGKLLGGRAAETSLIYVIYLGGLAVVAGVTVPLLASLAVLAPVLGMVIAWIIGIFVSGVAVDLLGRLCGYFLFAGGTYPGTETAETGPETPAEPSAPDFTPVVPLSPSAPLATSKPELGLIVGADSSKPALSGVRERLQDLVTWFGKEPDRALMELEDLQTGHAPDPLLLHSLCLLYDRAGRHDQSEAIAKDTILCCLEHEADRLAADVAALHRARLHAYGLGRDTLHRLAEAQLEGRALEPCEALFRRLLEMEPGDMRTVKGLMRLAETHLRDGTGDVECARAIYSDLIAADPDSPLGRYMRQGLQEAEMRLAG